MSSQEENTPTWSDVSPESSPGTFRAWTHHKAKEPKPLLFRPRILDVAPAWWLGEWVVDLLRLWLRDNQTAWRSWVLDPQVMDRLTTERTRLSKEFREFAGALPTLTLKERRALQKIPLEFSRLDARVTATSLRWKWLFIVMEMEVAAIKLYPPYTNHLSTVQKLFRSWPEYKKAERWRIWFWRQTPAGKASIRKSDARVKAKKKAARDAA